MFIQDLSATILCCTPSYAAYLGETMKEMGLTPDQIPLIWDRYYKIDKVHRRAMIGTGLGLSIVKQILESHRTTYGVESKLGEGSTFWFEMRVETVNRDTDDQGEGNPSDTPQEAEYLPAGHADS